jgi:hypothetical protein
VDRDGDTHDESYEYDDNGNRVEAVISSIGPSYSNVGGIWHFNEGSGSTLADESGNAHGMLYGSPTWSSDIPWAGTGDYSVLFNTGSG